MKIPSARCRRGMYSVRRCAAASKPPVRLRIDADMNISSVQPPPYCAMPAMQRGATDRRTDEDWQQIIERGGRSTADANVGHVDGDTRVTDFDDEIRRLER